MGVNFDRWTLLKLIEVILVLICLTFKRVTDDEATRVFLYLQKISREWTLLNNITWSKVGASLADATFGGYFIITLALFIGKLCGELPTTSRITEYILLSLGAILFIVLGSLSYAALDSVPHDLVDNAAVVGTVSLVTAGLFLLDMGGPKAKKPSNQTIAQQRKQSKQADTPKSITQQVYEIEKEIQRSERRHLDTPEEISKPKKDNGHKNGGKNGGKNGKNGTMMEMEPRKGPNGYQQMQDDFPRSFGIYGRDMVDVGSETDDTEEIRMPPKMEPHSPVWSNIRKGQYGKYNIVPSPLVLPLGKEKEMEEIRPPSRPGDPGYVQYTAQHWGETGSKTPRHSPTQV